MFNDLSVSGVQNIHWWRMDLLDSLCALTQCHMHIRMWNMRIFYPLPSALQHLSLAGAAVANTVAGLGRISIFSSLTKVPEESEKVKDVDDVC